MTPEQENKWREEFEKEFPEVDDISKRRQRETGDYDSFSDDDKWSGYLTARKAAQIEIDELGKFNCDLASENRKLQEQCEILIENAECRGDDDCDHCEAIRVCKPCQLENDIIEAMKKELKDRDQEISNLKEIIRRQGKSKFEYAVGVAYSLDEQLKERDELIREAIPEIEYRCKNQMFEWLEKAKKILGEG